MCALCLWSPETIVVFCFCLFVVAILCGGVAFLSCAACNQHRCRRFIDVQAGVLINGGRRNSIKYNTFVNTDLAVFWRDAGEGCWPDDCNFKNIYFRMNQMPFRGPTWSVRYPEMTDFEIDYPGLPVYTEIVGNRFCGNATIFCNDCNACGTPEPENAHGPCPTNQSAVIMPCSEKMTRYYLSTFAKNVEDTSLVGCKS
eukprot:COSAG05_NODE_1365_length_5065_cov_3.435360_3_plen_199_part_00